MIYLMCYQINIFIVIMFLKGRVSHSPALFAHLLDIKNDPKNIFLKLFSQETFFQAFLQLKSSSFWVSLLPKSSSFWVSPLPKSSSFCVSPLPGSCLCSVRKRGHAKRAGFRKRVHRKRAGFRKRGHAKRAGFQMAIWLYLFFQFSIFF